MISARQIVSDLIMRECEDNDIRLSLGRDGRLSIDAPEDALNTELLEQLHFNKSEILVAIERFEERAAIIEFEAGFSRQEAERMARIDANA